MKKLTNKTYLGDSVYCESKDGFIILTTENDHDASNIIYMEDEVLLNFIKFVELATDTKITIEKVKR